MTSVWVAEHGSCYLHAIIDWCTRERPVDVTWPYSHHGWSLDVRCRAAEAIAVVDQAAAARQVRRAS